MNDSPGQLVVVAREARCFVGRGDEGLFGRDQTCDAPTETLARSVSGRALPGLSLGGGKYWQWAHNALPARGQPVNARGRRS